MDAGSARVSATPRPPAAPAAAVPERALSLPGDTTSTCVDPLDDISLSSDGGPEVGIDIGEVALAEEPGFLVATFNIASIGDYENWNVTARNSLQSATENAQFMVSVRNAETHATTTFRTWLTYTNRWTMYVSGTDLLPEIPVDGGTFDAPTGMSAVMRMPTEYLPGKPWEWNTHVRYDNSGEACPGGYGERDLWLRYP